MMFLSDCISKWISIDRTALSISSLLTSTYKFFWTEVWAPLSLSSLSSAKAQRVKQLPKRPVMLMWSTSLTSTIAASWKVLLSSIPANIRNNWKSSAVFSNSYGSNIYHGRRVKVFLGSLVNLTKRSNSVIVLSTISTVVLRMVSLSQRRDIQSYGRKTISNKKRQLIQILVKLK